MAVVTSDGSVLWVPPVNFLVRCEHTNNDITNCTLKSVTALLKCLTFPSFENKIYVI